MKTVLAGAVLFALGFFLSVTGGFSDYDESWALRVAQRVAVGETLYRDVFFGVTPLSVYLTAAAVRIFGVQILVVKGVLILCLVVSTLAAGRILRQLGLPRGDAVLLAIGLLVFGRPEASPYSALSTALLMLCFSATLQWSDAERAVLDGRQRPEAANVPLAAAGLAVGLAFASKQNTGAFALAALVVAIVAHPAARGKTRKLLLACGASAFAVALVLLPVWRDGALLSFVEMGFLGKGAYLRHAWISYLEGFAASATIIDIYRFLAPPATVALLLAAWLRGRGGDRYIDLVVSLFVGAGFLTMFPRTDSPHLIQAMPALAVGLAFGLRRILSGQTTIDRRITGWAFAVWLALPLAAFLIRPIVAMTRGELRASVLPYARGTLITAERESAILVNAAALATATNGRAVLLLVPNAGLYYLATGLRNPTPYDYPLVTTFGRRGQQRVIDQISQGHITHVCLGGMESSSLAPVELVDWVQTRMERVRSLGLCTLYRRR